MIRFISDGMTSTQDWKVLKRRHTWDLLASLFQSENDVGGTNLRTSILEVKPVLYKFAYPSLKELQ